MLDEATGFERRFMGRMETGRTTTSDPAMGAGPPARLGFGDAAHSHAPPAGGHPDLPRSLTHLPPSAAVLARGAVHQQALAVQGRVLRQRRVGLGELTAPWAVGSGGW